MKIPMLLTISLAVVGVSCTNDDPPTAVELAASLVDVDTFDGDWTISLPPDAAEGAETGVVSDSDRELLPRLDLCDAAADEARLAVDEIRWLAFRQIDRDVDDPIGPPRDRTGHRVFVQQFLMSADTDQIERTFDLISRGMEDCLGPIAAGEEGPGVAVELELPPMGDDRYGVTILMDEAGGWAQWRMHGALVRKGPVLTSLVIVDITAHDDPLYTADEIASMIETAVDRI